MLPVNCSAKFFIFFISIFFYSTAEQMCGNSCFFTFFPPVMNRHTRKAYKEEWGARMAKPWGDMNMDLPGYCSKICKFIQLNLYTLITRNGQSTWRHGSVHTWLFWSRHHHHHRAAILLNGVHGEGYHDKQIKVGDSFETLSLLWLLQ